MPSRSVNLFRAKISSRLGAKRNWSAGVRAAPHVVVPAADPAAGRRSAGNFAPRRTPLRRTTPPSTAPGLTQLAAAENNREKPPQKRTDRVSCRPLQGHTALLRGPDFSAAGGPTLKAGRANRALAPAVRPPCVSTTRTVTKLSRLYECVTVSFRVQLRVRVAAPTRPGTLDRLDSRVTSQLSNQSESE